MIGLGKVEDVGLGCVGVEFLLANPLIILQTLLELFCIHQEFSKYASNAPNIYLLIIALVANYDFWSGERHAFEFEAVVARSAGHQKALLSASRIPTILAIPATILCRLAAHLLLNPKARI